MAYIANTRTGCIHDASKPHTKGCQGTHFKTVDTISEALAKIRKHGKKPQACKRCGFPAATVAEIET